MDLLILNEHEAAVVQARLGTMPVAHVVTRGAAGARWVRGGAVLDMPAFPVRAVDTTGAGDCWCGVLAAALDRGLAMEAAMRRASAAAALACTRPGAASACPMAAETDALLG